MLRSTWQDDEYTGNSGGALPAPLSGYQPGFINMTVPENSPLVESGLPQDSPGQVSMELTMPVQVALAERQQQLQQQQQQSEAEAEEGGWAGRHVPGEVTIALPSLGALAAADELEEGLQAGASGWGGLEPTVNLTANITAALPGLNDLVAEDEEATAGMDLTEPTGAVLAVAAAQQVEQVAEAEAAVAPTQEEEGTTEKAGDAGPQDSGEVIAPVRLSSGTDELVMAERAGDQAAKWGFAPGREDTMDINLELHGVVNCSTLGAVLRPQLVRAALVRRSWHTAGPASRIAPLTLYRAHDHGR